MSWISRIGPKGQIVIPPHLRYRYGLTEGAPVMILEENGRLALEATDFEAVLALGGSLSDLPLEEELMREREAERSREDSR